MVEEREETKELEDLEDPDQFLAMEAFVICEEDNENGLTWKEVSDCIVSSVFWSIVIKLSCLNYFLTYRKVVSTNASRFVTRLVFKHTKNLNFLIATTS